MPRNILPFERTARLVIGLAIVVVALGFEPPHLWLALLAIIPIGTAVLGYCPLYQVLGYDPCRRQAR